MGFKEVVSLDCDNAISLGGHNKKTGKANPSRIEGYYIGNRQVVSAKAKSGFCLLHVFQTKDGLTGVWGKTDLDRKLATSTAGAMTRVTFTGMKETKNNPMYVFKVEVDADNTIDVSGLANSTADSSESEEEGYGSSDESVDSYNEDGGYGASDEVDAPPARAPRTAAQPASPAQQAKVKGLLGGKNRSA